MTNFNLKYESLKMVGFYRKQLDQSVLIIPVYVYMYFYKPSDTIAF